MSTLQEAFHRIGSGDIEGGAGLLEALALAGDAEARHQWARLHLFGMRQTSSKALGLEALDEAIARGSEAARYTRAVVQCTDEGGPDRWWEDLCRAAEAGHPLAWRSMGVIAGQQHDDAAQAFALAALAHSTRLGDPVAAALLRSRDARPTDAPLRPVPAIDLEYARRRLQPLAIDAMLHVEADALSAEETRYLQAVAQPLLRPSRAYDPDSGAGRAVPIRTSMDASLDPLLEDVAMRLIQRRLCSLAGLPASNAEPLAVLRYLPGQEYRLHRDILPPSLLADPVQGRGGQRAATVVTYLAAPDEGGETHFPRWGQTIAPRPGSALAFRNTDADGKTIDDSLHAGLPVVSGVKWIATLWIRSGTLRTF